MKQHVLFGTAPAFLLIFFLSFSFSFAQSPAELKGTVTLKELDGSVFPGDNVTVSLQQSGVWIAAVTTDMNGDYWIKGIAPGTYDVQFQTFGFVTSVVKGKQFFGGQTQMLDRQLTVNTMVMDSIVIVADPVVVMKPDDLPGIFEINRRELRMIPTSNIIEASRIGPGSFSGERDGSHNFASRSGALVIWDGLKVSGGNLPLTLQAVENIQQLNLGVPAEYGDATGGITLVTSRNITPKYFGGIEGRSSQLFDNYKENLVTLYAGGPLIWRKDSAGKKEFPLAGFFITGEGSIMKDPSPVQGGSWIIKESAMEALRNGLLKVSPDGTGSRLGAEFLRASDFEKVASGPNANTRTLNFMGKFDFRLSKSSLLTVGGFFNFQDGRQNLYNFSLLNSTNNPYFKNLSYNIYGRFSQQFYAKRDTNGEFPTKFRHAEISLQADYLRGQGWVMNDVHGKNFFDYGHIGNFTLHRAPAFTYGYDPKLKTSGWLYQGMRDTLVEFIPGTANPDAAAYTSQYFSLFDQSSGFYNQYTSIQNGGGLLNGMSPRAPYNIWNNFGTTYDGYSKTDNNQFRVTGYGTATVGDHTFRLGFEFEQRTDRGYNLNPAGLWTSAHLLTNSHFGTLDTANPWMVIDPVTGKYNDTILYSALYRLDEARLAETGYTFGVGQSFFDWNLRQKLGLNEDGLDYINVHGLDPSQLSLSMFSADELLRQGNSYVSYFGYDPYGNKLGGNTGFSDFFTAKDKYGNYTRPVAPFQPVYMAGYISDKFTFKDIIFNVGLRADRFDANQEVLKDRYSLYETRKAGEVSELNGEAVNHPGNIGDDFVVYVNDQQNPTSIKGYRSGSTWYNAEGEVINDPSVLRTSSGKVEPYLLDNQVSIQTPGFDPSAGFTDYKPQVNLMPRIAFSFPINDRIQFMAHYDVLTQRPANVRMNYFDYLFWDNPSYNSGGRIFNNPSLRPERVTDFSLGFRTAFDEAKTVGLKVAAFYREMRDMLAIVKVSEAYPRSYQTFDNLDFATVKGAYLEFMIRKQDLYVVASYTLQFADGTGSSNFSQLNLVNSGQPNLRSSIPLNYDRRHLLSLYGAYTFAEGFSNKDWVNRVLKNFSISLQLKGGSGVPFSRQSNFTGEGFISGGGQPSLLGSINGSRYPWEFICDMGLSKDFIIRHKKKGEDGEEKSTLVNVYLNITNLFNTRNLVNAYAATGEATDDGYLTAAQFQTFINSQIDPQSFRDLYETKVNNPGNYSLPRSIRLGFRIGF